MVSEKTKKWFFDNKEKMKAYHKTYYKNNKEMIDTRNRLYAVAHRDRMVKTVQRYVIKNRDKVLRYRNSFESSFIGRYRSLKYRHNKRKWDGEIMSFDEFVEISQKLCLYCGDISKFGIDRIDNEKGYVKDNSVPCCKLCNYMKRTLSQKDFLDHIGKIYINKVSH